MFIKECVLIFLWGFMLSLYFEENHSGFLGLVDYMWFQTLKLDQLHIIQIFTCCKSLLDLLLKKS